MVWKWLNRRGRFSSKKISKAVKYFNICATENKRQNRIREVLKVPGDHQEEEDCGAHQLVVHPEKGHLTGLVEEVGEGDESFSLLQVQDQHGGDEGHPLDLKHMNQQVGRTERDKFYGSAIKPRTHVANVGSIAGVRSQNAVQQVMVRAALETENTAVRPSSTGAVATAARPLPSGR